VFDLKTDFKDLFEAFLANTENVLELPLYTDYFPSMASGRIRAIFTRYETATPGAASFVIDMGQQLALPNAKTVDTTGLTVRARGTALRLRVKGDKTLLGNAYLVMSYKAGA
jgi:hypothetical protein